MALSDTDIRQQHNCNGSAQTFAFGHPFTLDDDLTVILTDSDGNETTLAKVTDYTVTGAGNPAGGSITTVETFASGNVITIIREPDATQETSFLAGGNFSEEDIENALDKITELAQMVLERTGRALLFKPSDTTSGLFLPAIADNAGKVIGYNAGGDAIIAYASTASGDADLNDLLNAGYSNIIYPASIQLPTGRKILSGAGTPEGNITAPVGSLYLRTDGTVGTVAYHKQSGVGDTGWVSVQVAIDASAYDTFADAVTAAAGLTLLISTEIEITADTTIPSTVHTKIVPGGSFAVSNTKTLTINGPFNAGLYQVFSGLGSVSFGAEATNETAPEWWGAKADKVTESSAAIQSAIDSLPATQLNNYLAGIVKFQPGTYLTNTTLTNVRHGLTLKGSGVVNTILKSTSTAGPILQTNSAVARIEKLTITDMGFDQGGGGVIAGSEALHIRLLSGVVLNNVYFHGFDKAIRIENTDNMHIDNATYSTCKQAIFVPAEPLGSLAQGYPDFDDFYLTNSYVIGMTGTPIEILAAPKDIFIKNFGIYTWGDTAGDVGIKLATQHEDAFGVKERLRHVEITGIRMESPQDTANWGIDIQDFNSVGLTTHHGGIKISDVNLAYADGNGIRIDDVENGRIHVIDTIPNSLTSVSLGANAKNFDIHVIRLGGTTDGGNLTNAGGGSNRFFDKNLDSDFTQQITADATGTITTPRLEWLDAVQPRFIGSATTDQHFHARVTTDAEDRFYQRADGKMFWGDGTVTPIGGFGYQSGKIGTNTTTDLIAGDGSWNGGHFVMGSYHLWVDATGDLRIKNGAPANDTDGAIVGTQS
ncbi:MAG: hypothetical protein KAR06_11750 [Deltaproteobacteria bacterium]|nr:hypothetical protein [Deltaproteobacteria bacterium]